MKSSLAHIAIRPLTIRVPESLHIGSGYDSGLIQRAHVRDHRRNIVIPGAALKGRVRDACEQLLPRYGLAPCPAPAPDALALGHQPETCLVCRVFGAPGLDRPDGRALFWQAAALQDEGLMASRPDDRQATMGQTSARTQVQLSRARGMAAEDRLYTTEFTAPGLVFETQIEGWMDLTHCDGEVDLYYELILLAGGLRLLSMLGGNRSRGAGTVEVTLPQRLQVKLEKEEARPLETAAFLGNIDLLEYYELEAGGASHG